MENWNSEQYSKFEKERFRPAEDLINRINGSPSSVLDLGCGPGNVTKHLAKRFPSAKILGVDSSENMLSTAKNAYPEIEFSKKVIPDDLSTLGRFGLIFSNACLHWIPDHETILPQLLKMTEKLAVQMPLTQKAPFYKLLDDLVTAEFPSLRDVRNFHNLSPEKTYDVLSAVAKVDMWETEYYHVLPSTDAILDWYKGSGLRPYLQRLDENEKARFSEKLYAKLKTEFPRRADGTVILKMPRLFFIAAV